MHALAAALSFLAAALLILRRNELRGTTALAPLFWAFAALIAVGASELGMALRDASVARASPLRYLAAVATFCPLVAVLGAKRPQDRGWQFIVASLWMVLSLPAWEALLYWPDSPLQLHAVWRWCFLWPLLVIGLANNLPTRYWASALATFLGQLALLCSFFPEMRWLSFAIAPDTLAVVGATLLGVAAGLWVVHVPRRVAPPPSIDRAFIEFRDLFGAIWGLRIAARFNAAAALCDWRVWLTWNGLVETNSAHATSQENTPASSHDDLQLQAAMRQTLTQLLRRFVSDDWLRQYWR